MSSITIHTCDSCMKDVEFSKLNTVESNRGVYKNEYFRFDLCLGCLSDMLWTMNLSEEGR
jgi:hypothetical protein